MLSGTEARDRDQVVYRNRRKALLADKSYHGMQSPERQKRLGRLKVLMVDLAWIWFIPSEPKDQKDQQDQKNQEKTLARPDTIVTSFPQRWCQQDHNDPDLFESMKKFEGRPPSIFSCADLLSLISSKCVNYFGPSVATEDGKFSEYFESEIGEAVSTFRDLEEFQDLLC